MSAPPTRRRRPVSLLPDARHGLASVVAVGGTGRLRHLRRALAGRSPHTDRFGIGVGLEAGLVSLRTGRTP